VSILIAGVGNELKGDDAFGVEAAKMLGQDPRLPSGCIIQQTGIGGIHLVQELMRGYEALILFDAFDRGGSPGDLWLLEPELPQTGEMSDRERRNFFADVHYATPVRALTLAQSVGALPPFVRIIGCQPHDPDSFGVDMHKDVRDALPKALDMAISVIGKIAQE
jgi:hydrogenase maturation protease